MLVVRRMATWWQCAIMLVFTLGFGWILGQGLRSKSADVYGHVLIPLYGVWLYATLSTLLNKHSLMVSPQGLTIRNGPVPVRGVDRIPRENIACCYFRPVTVSADHGDEVLTIGVVNGVETVDGRQVDVFGEHKTVEASRAYAIEMARALNQGVAGPPVEVRIVSVAREDPVEIRRVWIWVAICVAAFIAGCLWEAALRWQII
jgi:hypothetical protein